MSATKEFMLDCEAQMDVVMDTMEQLQKQMDTMLNLVWCAGSTDLDAESGTPFYTPDAAAVQYIQAMLSTLDTKLEELKAAL